MIWHWTCDEMLDQTLFMWWDVNFLFDIFWVGLKWSCCLYGLCKWGPNWLMRLLPCCCPCQHPCGVMSSPLSMSLPRQITCYHCHPRHLHVSSHVIRHVIDAWHVIESVTKIILFVMFIFVIENGLGLGFGGPGIFCDVFETSWIKQFMTKI